MRSLTIASDGASAPWSLALLFKNFRALNNLEHLTVATIDPISETPLYWRTIDAFCGSGRMYNSLETMEFCFGSARPASGVEHVSREGLGEKLPYLAEHGMLKVSDPNVYVLPHCFLPCSSDFAEFIEGWIGCGLDISRGPGSPPVTSLPVVYMLDTEHEFTPLHQELQYYSWSTLLKGFKYD